MTLLEIGRMSYIILVFDEYEKIRRTRRVRLRVISTTVFRSYEYRCVVEIRSIKWWIKELSQPATTMLLLTTRAIHCTFLATCSWSGYHHQHRLLVHWELWARASASSSCLRNFLVAQPLWFQGELAITLPLILSPSCALQEVWAEA